jgi:hypothetical protein
MRKADNRTRNDNDCPIRLQIWTVVTMQCLGMHHKALDTRKVEYTQAREGREKDCLYCDLGLLALS